MVHWCDNAAPLISLACVGVFLSFSSFSSSSASHSSFMWPLRRCAHVLLYLLFLVFFLRRIKKSARAIVITMPRWIPTFMKCLSSRPLYRVRFLRSILRFSFSDPCHGYCHCGRLVATLNTARPCASGMCELRVVMYLCISEPCIHQHNFI